MRKNILFGLYIQLKLFYVHVFGFSREAYAARCGMIKKTKKVSGSFVQLYNYIAVLGPLCIILLVAEKNSVKKGKKFRFYFFQAHCSSDSEWRI